MGNGSEVVLAVHTTSTVRAARKERSMGKACSIPSKDGTKTLACVPLSYSVEQKLVMGPHQVARDSGISLLAPQPHVHFCHS